MSLRVRPTCSTRTQPQVFPAAPPSPELTARQREILVLVADGLSYKEVGATLNLSEHTVKYHMGETLHRLHLKNRAQVVAYALRSGLAKG